VEILINW